MEKPPIYPKPPLEDFSTRFVRWGIENLNGGLCGASDLDDGIAPILRHLYLDHKSADPAVRVTLLLARKIVVETLPLPPLLLLGRLLGRSGFFLFAFLSKMLFQCRLLGENGVYLVVEVFDHDLRLEVDAVIVLRAAAVLFLLPAQDAVQML